MVKRLLLAVPLGCLRFEIVVFPDHTHYFCILKIIISHEIYLLCSMHLFQTSVPCSCSRQSISVPALFQTSVPCSCSRQSISVLALFHAAVPDFGSVQLFQTKVFPFLLSSRLPFHAAVPDKVFPFQLCSRLRSMQLFLTKKIRSSFVPCIFYQLPFNAAVSDISISVPALFQTSSSFHAAIPNTVYPFQLCSMQLLLTSVPCSCSRQRIQYTLLEHILVPDQFHAFVLDFRSMQLFHFPFHSILCSIPYSIPCSALCFSYRLVRVIPSLNPTPSLSHNLGSCLYM